MRTFVTMTVAALALVVAMPAAAGDAKDAAGKRYLITTTHTPEQCLAALDEMAAKNKAMLDKMQWGCPSGDHTGYAFVDAKDEKAAMDMLPVANRATAKATMVTTFTPEKLKSIHEKMDAKK